MRRIYLDANATTPMPLPVRRAMGPWMGCGNPGSIHVEGRKAKAAVEKARAQVAALIGAQPSEIVFTSGGTEADNAALRGVGAARLRMGETPSGVLLTTPMEHKAVLGAAEALQRDGWAVAYAQVEPRTGRLLVGGLRAGLETRPALISIMLANNEVGTRFDGAVRLAARTGAVVHTDAVNALGKIPINVRRLGVGLASFSAHKIGGPKGVGALYVRHDLAAGEHPRWAPWVLGGGQEEGRRGGTLNVAGVVGFGVAASLARQRLRRGETARLGALTDAFRDVLIRGLPGVQFLGPPPPDALPNTVTLALASGVDARNVVARLDEAGVAASAGSACGCKGTGGSHVLAAIGCEVEAVRFSFGWYNKSADAADAARRTVRILRDTTPTLNLTPERTNHVA